MPELKLKIYPDIDVALSLISQWQSVDDTIVFTNGCFDIIHSGHVSYLEEAKALGDRLVVGLNSDASISRIKGHNRPIITENHRATVLSALASVDMVIIFQEDTPIELIKRIKPQYLVKGGDYKEKDMIGADIVVEHSGKVQILSFTEGISTTEIIKKIQAAI